MEEVSNNKLKTRKTTVQAGVVLPTRRVEVLTEKESEGLYEKGINQMKRKWLIAEEMKIIKTKSELAMCKSKPTLNKTTDLIVKRSKSKPLYLRIDEEMRKKAKMIDEIRTASKSPEVIKKNIKCNSKEFFKRNEVWENKKKEKINKLAKFIEEFEEDWEECTFAPKTNKGRKLSSTVLDRSKEFLRKREKNKTIKKEKYHSELTFRPVINTNVKAEYSTKPVEVKTKKTVKKVELKKTRLPPNETDMWSSIYSSLTHKKMKRDIEKNIRNKIEQPQVVIVKDDFFNSLVQLS